MAPYIVSGVALIASLLTLIPVFVTAKQRFRHVADPARTRAFLRVDADEAARRLWLEAREITNKGAYSPGGSPVPLGYARETRVRQNWNGKPIYFVLDFGTAVEQRHNIALGDFKALEHFLRLGAITRENLGFVDERDAHNFDERTTSANLVLVGSPHSNPVSERFIVHCGEAIGLAFGSPGQKGVYWNGAFHESPYDPTRENAEDIVRQDLGVIVYARNPWAFDAAVVLIAGSFALGTWGAALALESQKEFFRDKYAAKPFAALVEVTSEGPFGNDLKVSTNVLSDKTLSSRSSAATPPFDDGGC